MAIVITKPTLLNVTLMVGIAVHYVKQLFFHGARMSQEMDRNFLELFLSLKLKYLKMEYLEGMWRRSRHPFKSLWIRFGKFAATSIVSTRGYKTGGSQTRLGGGADLGVPRHVSEIKELLIKKTKY